jgi:hypothetical protein
MQVAGAHPKKGVIHVQACSAGSAIKQAVIGGVLDLARKQRWA